MTTSDQKERKNHDHAEGDGEEREADGPGGLAHDRVLLRRGVRDVAGEADLHLGSVRARRHRSDDLADAREQRVAAASPMPVVSETMRRPIIVPSGVSKYPVGKSSCSRALAFHRSRYSSRPSAGFFAFCAAPSAPAGESLRVAEIGDEAAAHGDLEVERVVGASRDPCGPRRATCCPRRTRARPSCRSRRRR